MNRMRALLAAGGLTSLVLGTVLALSLRPDGLAAAMDRLSPAAAVEMTLEDAAGQSPGAGPANAGTLLEQNRQLKDALELMQAREAQYRQQIERANEVIGQAERAAASSAVSETYAYAEDDEDHDERDDERDEDHDDQDGEHEDHDDHEAHDD
jgi:hypothetical protein